jgi:PAS domain S-box-containing protein
MLKSLRYRLLAWFLAFVLLTAALMVPVSLKYHSRENKIGQVTQQINSLYIDYLKDTKSVNDFLTMKPANSDFFIGGENPYLNDHLKLSAGISSSLEALRKSRDIRSFGIASELSQLSDGIKQYNSLFDSLVYFVYKRGYRNFGLEGELDNYGRMLENAGGQYSHELFKLRQLEKEYLYSNGEGSVESFRTLVTLIKNSISSNTAFSKAKREKTLELVANYTGAFYRLAELDSQTGLRKNIALNAMLNKRGSHIESVFSGLTARSETTQKAMIHQLNIYYILSLCFIIMLSIIFSYAAARHVVSRLEALTDYISVLTTNKETSRSIDLHNSAREIKQIYREFRNLLSQLKIWEKQHDSALKMAEYTQKRYQELADMLPQSVFETNSMGNFTYVNKAWYKAFGYTEADLGQGLNLIETVMAGSGSENIMGQDKIENSGFIALRKDGSRFPASVYTDNIVTEGIIAGRRGIIVDITDNIEYIKTLEKETSKAKSSDELKSSFLANMSHEIRTPMNSIIGFSNLLASEQIQDLQKKEFVQYIRTSSEVLLNLVDDIIDIAKIEAGQLNIVKKDCELHVLGNELLTTSLESRKKFNKQQIQLIFVPDPAYPELYLKTDPFRLRQVLINLINNAIKFTEKGSVKFGYSIKEDKILEFFIEDTGIGLSRNELDQIFERFKRSRHSEEKNITGTGLGLAISKNLVQLLGGDMWVDSIPGTGTTFRFTIPYLKSTHLPPHADSRNQAETTYNWKNVRILIAEDDMQNFTFLHEILQKTQSEILHARNGKEAVNLFKNNSGIQLVLMDIQLPEMDGIEASRRIKAINRSVPIIAQTAFAMSGDRDKLKQAGFDDYLAKPLDIQLVLAVINRHLGEARKALLKPSTVPQRHQ